MADVSATHHPEQSIPIWRDTRYIAILLQILFVIAVAVVTTVLYTSMMAGLERAKISPSYSFLDDPANFPIGEGIEYQPSDSYGRAFVVGLVNTLRVSVLGVVLATLLGLVVGISRLSTNWLLRKTAEVFVELMRNIPLLVLLFFLLAVTQTFPPVKESVNFFGLAYFNNRGVVMAWPLPSESFGMWQLSLVAAVLVGIGIFIWRKKKLQEEDRAGLVLPWALLATFVVGVLGFFMTMLITGIAPLYPDIPVLDKFNFSGGLGLTSFFFVMLVGLVIYTAAFIGEIVRAGIMAVSKGQREAATALGLTQAQSLRLIILPQALRVMIPPMTNQYLNLTKNSSLAVAVGYPDLFAIGSTIANQTGQAVTMILIIMGCYLTISLLTSLGMNYYNRRIQLVER